MHSKGVDFNFNLYCMDDTNQPQIKMTLSKVTVQDSKVKYSTTCALCWNITQHNTTQHNTTQQNTAVKNNDSRNPPGFSDIGKLNELIGGSTS